MDSFANMVGILEEKTLQLLERKKELMLEVTALKGQLKEQQSKSISMETEIDELKEKNKILRISKGVEGEDKGEIRLKINEIVREVDKCISQLNQ